MDISSSCHCEHMERRPLFNCQGTAFHDGNMTCIPFLKHSCFELINGVYGGVAKESARGVTKGLCPVPSGEDRDGSAVAKIAPRHPRGMRVNDCCT